MLRLFCTRFCNEFLNGEPVRGIESPAHIILKSAHTWINYLKSQEKTLRPRQSGKERVRINFLFFSEQFGLIAVTNCSPTNATPITKLAKSFLFAYLTTTNGAAKSVQTLTLGCKFKNRTFIQFLIESSYHLLKLHQSATVCYCRSNQSPQ